MSLTARVLLVACVLLPNLAVAQEDRFFDSKGVRIRYVEQGEGEPVVLLHGVGGSLNNWLDSGIFKNLAADYRVIAIDQRGHGKSGKPRDTKAYGREMAEDVARLLDHLQIRRAHIVGYSMGAQINALLLTMHPDRYLTATLGGGAGRFDWDADQDGAAEAEAKDREKECVSRTLMARLSPPNEPKPSEAQIRRLSEACFADPAQDRFAVAALARSRKDQVITPEQVKAVQVPTLAIVGSLDPAVPAMKALQMLRPSIQLVTIDGATHGGARGATGRPEFVAALRQFLRFHRQGTN
jgi:pimeloyl-ACP methyl ester carboxylesterase